MFWAGLAAAGAWPSGLGPCTNFAGGHARAGAQRGARRAVPLAWPLLMWVPGFQVVYSMMYYRLDWQRYGAGHQVWVAAMQMIKDVCDFTCTKPTGTSHSNPTASSPVAGNMVGPVGVCYATINGRGAASAAAAANGW
jgi:DNA-binding helix-hairpin-helix protein with protein kinase domain